MWVVIIYQSYENLTIWNCLQYCENFYAKNVLFRQFLWRHKNKVDKNLKTWIFFVNRKWTGNYNSFRGDFLSNRDIFSLKTILLLFCLTMIFFDITKWWFYQFHLKYWKSKYVRFHSSCCFRTFREVTVLKNCLKNCLYETSYRPGASFFQWDETGRVRRGWADKHLPLNS